MLKFKTFNVIMLILQVVASGINFVWSYRGTEKSNVFYSITVASGVQIAYCLVVWTHQISVVNLIAAGGKVLVLSCLVK